MKLGLESMAACWDEVAHLYAAHFGSHCDPDRERYLAYEADNALFLATCRDGGRLVGFALMYVFASMHDRKVLGREDFFYLLPEARLGWNALRLLAFVERECRRRGCEAIEMTTAISSNAASIIEERGYVMLSANYRKSLVRADSPIAAEAVK